MKKLFIIIAFFSLTSVAFATAPDDEKSVTEQQKKPSAYKKATRLLDKIVTVAKPAVEKAAQALVDDTAQSIKDFEEDLTAPKEEQSGFAKFFNFICDVPGDENLGWQGETEEVPEGIF